jgi:hypothetical protein
LAVNLPYSDTARLPEAYLAVFLYFHFASEMDSGAVVVIATLSGFATWHGLVDRDDSDKPDLAIGFLHSFGRYASP